MINRIVSETPIIHPTDIDSFYLSSILIFSTDEKLCEDIKQLFIKHNFISIKVVHQTSDFISQASIKKNDLIICDLRTGETDKSGYDLLETIRFNDSDVSIITLSADNGNLHRHLELSINHHIEIPYDHETLMKASKKAIGDKISHEIGMQFFDALFGMQMCTHRDLHQRTFDHVVRTTKIFGKFLLYLSHKNKIQLTSWALKNCLMASLLHDIGKLLVMHGVLYKEGKLSQYEYEQVKRHPWYSITVLLGGQDIETFAELNGLQDAFSQYKQQNIGDQVFKWIFKIMDNDLSALKDVDQFFSDMIKKPSVHSLNKDLLYIVFRHHDGVKTSYHSAEDLAAFSKVLHRPIHTGLSIDSPLDLVTNALSICDMYDALLDTKRDYRKSSYHNFFALFLLYGEMKREKFFPLLTEEFIKFVVEIEEYSAENPFHKTHDPSLTFKTIENIYNHFNIARDQEWYFDNFIIEHKAELEAFGPDTEGAGFQMLLTEWKEYFDENNKTMQAQFYNELKKANIINQAISDLTPEEQATYELLNRFYISYSSPYKQKLLLDYLVDTIIEPNLDNNAKENLSKLIQSNRVITRSDLERLLIKEGYSRRNVFEVFKNYNEEILINELNDYLKKNGM